MKRLVLFFTLAFVVLISSCAKSPIGNDGLSIKTMYKCKAEIEYSDMTMTCEIERLSDGVWNLNFNEPSSLMGMEIKLNESKCEINYRGIPLSIDREDLPMNAIISSMLGAIDVATANSNTTVTSTKTSYKVEGKTQNGEFLLTVDRKNGTLKELEFKKIKLKVKFFES